MKNENDVIVKDKGLIQKEKDDFQKLLQGKTRRINKLKIQVYYGTKLAKMKEDADAVEIKLKIQIYLLNQSQTEIIVPHNSKMTEFRDKNKSLQRK